MGQWYASSIQKGLEMQVIFLITSLSSHLNVLLDLVCLQDNIPCLNMERSMFASFRIWEVVDKAVDDLFPLPHFLGQCQKEPDMYWGCWKSITRILWLMLFTVLRSFDLLPILQAEVLLFPPDPVSVYWRFLLCV